MFHTFEQAFGFFLHGFLVFLTPLSAFLCRAHVCHQRGRHFREALDRALGALFFIGRFGESRAERQNSCADVGLLKLSVDVWSVRRSVVLTRLPG